MTIAVPGGVLAIDAGNSKTDVALLAPDGTVLGRARGGGFQPHLTGAEAAVATLVPLAREAAEDAGLPPGEGPLASLVSAALANADFPAEERALASALRARRLAADVRVVNDTFAVLRAGVGEPRGVAVVCGAGTNCVGMLPDGRTARFPAVGRLSGDWGGGGHLAEEALWWAARAEDGRGEPSALAAEVAGYFGLPTVRDTIEALHFAPARWTAERHGLSPLLFRVAAAGDPVAGRLVERQAQEIVAMACVALARLGLLSVPAPVVLGGSVLAARHPQLEAAVLSGLAARAPLARPVHVAAPPVLGAALLGLDALAAAPAALARAAAQFTAPAGAPKPPAPAGAA
ncbi:BadF/BadG/BcrA/BcrD ATPase family protein [Streptomyces sp. SL13]|uniref:BadF/BadG/BcrA/BcrD ATPase family protein n=1 Tax=Streptantibioticus silvisoli TaxID=2705255 RepID=A0AA90H9K3_9ACTN|nr:BadF/BadG/BcrA/BcrD ATPase family protein [Streptantibioticus silvisoli]MDI5973690.1 BadF/BadG/BcrA/BcrD ATPase family protein [Streptantibioticus silvisoli]